MAIIINCVICKKDFLVPPSRSKIAKTCSVVCREKLHSSRKKQIEVICARCGKHFLRYPCRATAPLGKVYCSEKCHNEHRVKYRKLCIVCGETFDGTRLEQKCCSKLCSNKYNKKRRNPVNCYCNKCGNPMHKSAYQLKMGEGRFCSIECKKIWQTGLYNGESPAHYYSLPTWRKIRLTILKRDSYTCKRCGLISKSNHVNHIFLRQLGGSDNPDNLETLCKVCHPIVDTERMRILTNNPNIRARDFYKKYKR